jgi:polyphosphate kinase
MASADWMPRNLDKRVEILFPVLDEKLRVEYCDVLNAYFRDNCQSSVLDSNGKWTPVTPGDKEKPFRVQKEMLARAAISSNIPGPAKLEYVVRRSPQAGS